MQLNESQPNQEVDQADEHHEVIVVGGGQAGLAVGYFLAQQGRDFAILEAAAEPAAAWRTRWDSLKLFTSARYSGLPGLPFPLLPGGDAPWVIRSACYLCDQALPFQCTVSVSVTAVTWFK